MGFILFLVSIIIGTLFIPIALIYDFIKCFYHHHIGEAFKSLNEKFTILAVALDEYGNKVGYEILNDALLAKGSTYKYGTNDGDTISFVTHKNMVDGTLTPFGKFLAKVLIMCKDTAF